MIAARRDAFDSNVPPAPPTNEECGRECIATSCRISHDRHARYFFRRPSGAGIDDVTEPAPFTFEKLFLTSTR